MSRTITELTMAAALLALAGCSSTGTSPGTYSGGANAASSSATNIHTGETTQSRINSNGSSTVTTMIDPATGERRLTGANIQIGTGGAGLSGGPSGLWTLTATAQKCVLNFSGVPMAGLARVRVAGFCTHDLSQIAGWRTIGSDLILTDESGRPIGRLSPDGSRGYQGQVASGMFQVSARLVPGAA